MAWLTNHCNAEGTQRNVRKEIADSNFGDSVFELSTPLSMLITIQLDRFNMKTRARSQVLEQFMDS